ncbi:MAG: hypothetical protein E7240_00160 [Lachnospiraceae bacterium]|nr:hypothetical protein [Lachnospiraceae bacterium]
MKSDADREKIRRRLIRDLIAAAVVIVVFLAYFIPGIVAGMQDLSLAGRKSSYETEQVRFVSENRILAERLRTIHRNFDDEISFIELKNGQKMNRETAVREMQAEIEKMLTFAAGSENAGSDVPKKEDGPEAVCRYYLEALRTGDLEAEAYAGMAVNGSDQDPFILWVCDFYSEAGFDITGILDENSGKLLCLSVNDWTTGYAGWNYETLEKMISRCIAGYYEMNITGTALWKEEPYILTVGLEREGEVITLPVIISDGMFAFNSPESSGYFADYGVSAEQLFEHDSDEEPEPVPDANYEEVTEPPAEEEGYKMPEKDG